VSDSIHLPNKFLELYILSLYKRVKIRPLGVEGLTKYERAGNGVGVRIVIVVSGFSYLAAICMGKVCQM